MKLTFHGNSNVGKQRVINEDSFLILCDSENNWREVDTLEVDITNSKGVVFAVADGMGGSNAGEVASALAVRIVKDRFISTNSVPNSIGEIEKLLESIVYEGHDRINKEVIRDKNLEGMGTTIVLGWIFKNSLYLVWSGDSRCYIYNKNIDTELLPFTDDHSLVWERVKSKELSPEEARLNEYSNVILQSLGGSSQKPEPEFRWKKLKKNDRILFCSDGLNSMLSNLGLQQILDFNPSPKETCESLINAANNAGGRDNITAIIVDIIEESVPGTESSEFSDTKSNKPARKWKRNKIWFFLTLAILVFIAVFSILFTKRTTKSHLTLKEEINESTSEKVSGVTDDYTAAGVIDSIESKISSSVLAQNKTSNKKSQKEVNQQTISKSPEPDSNFLINQLEKSLQRINDLRKRVDVCYPPPKGMATVKYYEEYRQSLDSINNTLDQQYDLITKIADVMLTKIGKISDYNLGINKYSEIDDTLSELEDKMKKIEPN
jgi:protein phosphatase